MHRPSRIVAATILITVLASAHSHAQNAIPSGPMAPTRNAFLKMVQTEDTRTVREYEEHTEDPAELRDRAKEFLTESKKAFTQQPVTWTRKDFYEHGSKLIDDGSKDPLVVAYALQAWPNMEEYRKIETLYKQAIEDAIRIYEPQQQVEVIDLCGNTQTLLKRALWDMRRRKVTDYELQEVGPEVAHDAYIRWMESEADSIDLQRYMWHKITQRFYTVQGRLDNSYSILAENSREKKIHPWMRHMLDAFIKNEEGKQLRGNGDAYEAKYREVCKEYLAAWEIAPQYPEPATELLQQSRSGFVEGTPREWFDRVMLAEIDHPMAYTYYRTHLRSEGVDALIEFGEKCAATKRYDTKVPFELLECLWAVENHTGENIWAREGIYEKVRDLCQNALSAPKYMGKKHDESTRAWLNGTQLVIAARANRLEEIPPLWEKTNTDTLKRLANIYQLRTPLPSLKAAAIAARKEPTRLVNLVEKSLSSVSDEESLKLAAQQIETAASALDPDDPRVAQWRAALALYQDFYDGRRGKMTFPPDYCKLAGTETWEREDENTLVARGGEQLPLEFLTRLPFPLELSMDIEIIDVPKGTVMAGVQVGPPRPIPNQYGRGNFFSLNSKTNTAAVFLSVTSMYSTPPQKKVNELRARIWHGYRELFVNGDRIMSGQSNSFRPDGYATLCIVGAGEKDVHVRFSNLRVQRLNFEAPPDWHLKEERVEYFTRRLADEPDNQELRLDLATAKLDAGMYDEAVDAFDEILKVDPKSQIAIYSKGLTLAGGGKYAEAINQYQKLLDMPDKAKIRYTKIIFGDENAQDKVSIPVFHMRAYNQLAWLKATCPDDEFRDGEEAVRYAREAVTLAKGQHGECYLSAAAAFAEIGDFERAAKALKRVGRLDYQREEAYISPVTDAINSKQPFRDHAN